MSRSYRKEILEALKKHGKNTDLSKIDFKWLADVVGIKVKKVHDEFEDMADLIHHASLEYWGDHEKKSQKIIQLKGENALSTLIRHDVSNIYFYARDTPDTELEHPSNRTVLYVKDYIENGMPKNYFEVLRLNPELRPDKNMDIRLYAHFIVHSMFFCARDKDTMKSLDPEELKAPTRRIITSLFKPKTELV